MHGAVLQLFYNKTSVGTIPGINRYWSSLVFMNVLLRLLPRDHSNSWAATNPFPDRAGDGGDEKAMEAMKVSKFEALVKQ